MTDTQYTWTPTRVPDPDGFRNAIRNMGAIIVLHQRGEDSQAIADWLNEQGFLYDPETPWEVSNVERILKKLEQLEQP